MKVVVMTMVEEVICNSTGEEVTTKEVVVTCSSMEVVVMKMVEEVICSSMMAKEMKNEEVMTCSDNVVLDNALMVVEVICNNKMNALYILVEVVTCNNTVNALHV
jgi:hypothetical protein